MPLLLLLLLRSRRGRHAARIVSVRGCWGRRVALLLLLLLLLVLHAPMLMVIVIVIFVPAIVAIAFHWPLHFAMRVTVGAR